MFNKLSFNNSNMSISRDGVVIFIQDPSIETLVEIGSAPLSENLVFKGLNYWKTHDKSLFIILDGKHYEGSSPARHNQQWLGDEIDTLSKLVLLGVEAMGIAVALERTVPAVIARIKKDKIFHTLNKGGSN